MNEFLSEEIPYGDISHDDFLAVKICKGQRQKISDDVPKLLADLIIRCWDVEIEYRPTTKELYQILTKWNDEIGGSSDDDDSEDGEDNENNEDSANYAIQSTLANPISECLDVQLSESELNEICQVGENNIES
ncbi:unnamed protein product [Rhizophagus irregularis]|nr:unnamed protein product [Rhizophagus irregularis]CAB5365842.1 unnamed protein product [Rhizophagus irregularis]